jgi:hypothetical protein
METGTWHEKLPEQCPPSDAFEPNGFVCYRLCNGPKATEIDFISHRQLFPDRSYNVPECRARSLSIHKDLADSKKLKSLPAHREKTIFELVLSKGHGLVKPTGRDSHHSWWRSASCFPTTFAAPVGGAGEKV